MPKESRRLIMVAEEDIERNRRCENECGVLDVLEVLLIGLYDSVRCIRS